jgi:hypothetical protein
MAEQARRIEQDRADRQLIEQAAARLRTDAIRAGYAGLPRKDLAFGLALVFDELARHVRDLDDALRAQVVAVARPWPGNNAPTLGEPRFRPARVRLTRHAAWAGLRASVPFLPRAAAAPGRTSRGRSAGASAAIGRRGDHCGGEAGSQITAVASPVRGDCLACAACAAASCAAAAATAAVTDCTANGCSSRRRS